MLNIEIAELMNQEGTIMNWAHKVNKNIELSSEEKEIAQVINAWAKEIGEGKKPAYELAQYIVKTITPEVYNAPDEILDTMFLRGNVGEFDEIGFVEDAKNTLLAIESARAIGDVDKSYIDFTKTAPTWKHLQVNTEVSMQKLRSNGYKTVAELTTFAEEALKNKMFYSIFNAIDSAITAPSSQGFTASGSVTLAAADDATGYLLDRGQNPLLIGLSTLIRPMYKMDGYSDFLTEAAKDQINKYGILGAFNGARLVPVSAAKKLADGSPLLPTNRIVGIAAPIGNIDMRGEMRVLQEQDIHKEVINLKITGFEFGYNLNKIENACKIAIV